MLGKFTAISVCGRAEERALEHRQVETRQGVVCCHGQCGKSQEEKSLLEQRSGLLTTKEESSENIRCEQP
ncbi:hypothetical protein COCON_G00138670 [Conger conger]|uniref:Uncharacterized protein n=1 Tax=Conger conger TaxID=82655 RepID=A0A9Q1DG22_CONCO|nr:hypothetical protein COCON_G00138670 [Conger conger]